jgi:hypothetical protein
MGDYHSLQLLRNRRPEMESQELLVCLRTQALGYELALQRRRQELVRIDVIEYSTAAGTVLSSPY